MRYKVALAGLALSCLYMTVLGFDNITTGKHIVFVLSMTLFGNDRSHSMIFNVLM